MSEPAQPAVQPYKLCPRCRLIYPAGTNFCGRDREPLVADTRIIAGRYILLNQIGSGTMSEVYAAEQPQLGRKVAIKLLRRDLEVVRRFYSEVRAVGQIRHEHVVTIHDSGRSEDGRPYIAMEYLAGEDLASHLKRHGPMDSSRAMLLWRQAVSAVAAAHRQKVVHRDIKPANLFLTYKDGDDGPEEIIKVIDFSIAKLTGAGNDPRPTEPGAIVGTVLYMAPEQLARGEATPRSDVYSLGLVLLEMLTGQLPWGEAAGNTDNVGAALQRLIRAPAGARQRDAGPPFSEELLQLARDVLSQNPGERPADAGELLRRIKRLPEMAEWQRIPRRLSWPGPGERAPAAEPVPAGPMEHLGELLTEKVEDRPPRRPPPSRPGVSGGGAEPAYPSGGSLTELSDWTEEPTVPASEAALGQHMRSLEAALLAESQQARRAGIEFSADMVRPVSSPGISATGKSASAQPATRDEGSGSGSKGRVFSASELERRLSAERVSDTPTATVEAPELLSEEPTRRSTSPPVHVEDIAPQRNEPPPAPPPATPLQIAATAPLPGPASAQARRASGDLRRPSTPRLPAAARPRGTQRQRRLRSLGPYLLPLLFVSVMPLVARALRDLLRPQVAPRVAAELAAARPNRAPDRALGSADLGLEDRGGVADLGAATDGPAAPGEGPAAGADLLHVRFVYAESDGVSDVSCQPLDSPLRRTTQRHRTTVHVTLAPGAVCTLIGTGIDPARRRLTYAQLAQQRNERSGEVRYHARLAVAGQAPEDAPATSPSPAPGAHEPAAEPPAPTDAP